MVRRTKLWTSMQAVAFVGVTSITACSQDANQTSEVSEEKVAAAAMHHGEGAHGEGEGVSTALNLAEDDLAYQAQLGLMRGHLLVGNALYQQGFIEHAKTHMKHPESELYADVADVLISRGGQGFAAQLSQLADAVNNEQGDEAVAAAYANIVTAIKQHEALIADDSKQAIQQMLVAASLIRTAADEYAIGVVDGKTSNVHEYQDAYGFTQVSLDLVDSIDSEDLAVKVAQKKVKDLIGETSPLWPAIVPADTVDGEAGQLYGVAAQIEIIAASLK